MWTGVFASEEESTMGTGSKAGETSSRALRTGTSATGTGSRARESETRTWWIDAKDAGSWTRAGSTGLGSRARTGVSVTRAGSTGLGSRAVANSETLEIVSGNWETVSGNSELAENWRDAGSWSGIGKGSGLGDEAVEETWRPKCNGTGVSAGNSET